MSSSRWATRLRPDRGKGARRHSRADSPRRRPRPFAGPLLAEALQAQAILEVGVLRLLESTKESERLRADLVAHTPLLRGSGKERVADHITADHAFHHALVGALGNRLLVDIHEGLGLLAAVEEVGESALGDIRELMDMRHPLLSALEHGDFEAAVDAVGRQSNDLRGLLLGRASS